MTMNSKKFINQEGMKAMKQIIVLSMILMASLIGCSREKKEFGEPIDPNAKVITVDELVKNVKAYDGQMVTVEGWMGDICSDGEDFFFKGKWELIEVIPPEGQMPPSSLKGKPARVYGKVMSRHEEPEKGEAENEKASEPEVKIEAKGVNFK